MIRLEIGGFFISLDAGESPVVRWPPQNCGPFIESSEGEADLRFAVRLVKNLPELRRGRLLHDAREGFWKLFEIDGGLLIESLDPATMLPFNLAKVSSDFSRGEIFTSETSPGDWDPNRVINPIVEICLLTHLSRKGALMFHAAGIDWRGAGFVFTGPSGAGKSTLSGMFSELGALLLNDERVIVSDVTGSPVVHGTPWCGSNPVMHHAHAPLQGLYFIRHGADNAFRKLRAAEALSLCVKQAFLPYWDEPGMTAVLSSSEALFRKVEALEYSFLPHPSAVDSILARSGSHAEGLLQKVS